jgi:hypothetical protein
VVHRKLDVLSFQIVHKKHEEWYFDNQNQTTLMTTFFSLFLLDNSNGERKGKRENKWVWKRKLSQKLFKSGCSNIISQETLWSCLDFNKKEPHVTCFEVPCLYYRTKYLFIIFRSSSFLYEDLILRQRFIWIWSFYIKLQYGFYPGNRDVIFSWGIDTNILVRHII